MKRIFVTIIAVLGMAGGLFAQDAVDVKGAWTMSIETPQGDQPITLQFAEPQGEQITGVMISPQGDLKVTGKLTGKQISFTAVVDTPNGSFTLAFTGAVEKDSMGGDVDFAGRGAAKWSAKRPK